MQEPIEGRYELLEVIASGGMATVWRARDLRLRREVAIKRPHPSSVDDPNRPRLVREAHAAASISHPHLVTVFDVGEDDDGVYLVMELVDGQSLDRTSTDLGEAQVIDIGADIADALAVVHAAGIVHRDVKPANIILSSRGAQLTDFGVALDDSVSERLTQPGTVYATPAYAAPEVLAGEQPTSKSDVFSLAVVVYELLTGNLPVSDPPGTAAQPVGDRFLDATLGEAMAADPEARPDAATFASKLRGSTRTRAIVGVAGSTIPIPVPPLEASTSSGPSQPNVEHRSRRVVWIASVAIVGLALVALGAALNDGPPVSATASTSTTTEASTTTAPTTTTLPNTTSAVEEPDVESARAQLESVLGAISPSDLKPKDLKSMLEKVDEAIDLVAEGGLDEATKKLSEVDKDIEKKLSDNDELNAAAALEQLAEALGVSLD